MSSIPNHPNPLVLHTYDYDSLVAFWAALDRLSPSTSLDPDAPYIVDYSSPIQGPFPIRPKAFMLTAPQRQAHNAHWREQQMDWIVVNRREMIRLKEEYPGFCGFGVLPCKD